MGEESIFIKHICVNETDEDLNKFWYVPIVGRQVTCPIYEWHCHCKVQEEYQKRYAYNIKSQCGRAGSVNTVQLITGKTIMNNYYISDCFDSKFVPCAPFWTYVGKFRLDYIGDLLVESDWC